MQATLERGVRVLESTSDVALGIFESETVTMAMGLLTAVMGGASEVSARLNGVNMLSGYCYDHHDGF